MSGITAEYWIECWYCYSESVITFNTPSTGRVPKTKAEAWEAVRANGWRGYRQKPKCPNCVDEE